MEFLTPPQIRMKFSADAGASRAARRATWTLSEDPREDPFAERVGLVVSELVTNAVRHTGADAFLSVWRSKQDGSIRVEVTDRDPRFPVIPGLHSAIANGEGQPGGRGLRLLESCCSGWGIRSDRSGKTIWAELQPIRRGLVLSDGGTLRERGYTLVISPNTREASASDGAPEQQRPRLNGCLILDQDDATASMAFVGEFDEPEVDDIRPTVERLAETPPAAFDLDLGGVSYIGLPCLAMLLRLSDAALASGSSFRIRQASRIVTLLVHATGTAERLGCEQPTLKFKPEGRG